MVTGGISFPINVFYNDQGNFTFGGFGVKVGGGVYYFVIKNLGVGGEMHFNFAGAFGTVTPGGPGFSGWLGYWDFLAGIKAAF
jgi:hypothetical protein